jgi:hypothetical protein
MGNRRMAAALAAIVVAAGAVGCGSSGSDDENQSTATIASTGSFVEQANEICRTTGARLVSNYPTRPSEFRAWGVTANAAQDERIEGLRRLTPPTDQRADYIKMIGHLETARGQTDAIVARLAAGATTRELGRLGEDNIRELHAVRRIARKLGLTNCG